MTTFTTEDLENAKKLAEEAPYHPGYEDAAFSPPTDKISTEQRILEAYRQGYTNGYHDGLSTGRVEGSNH